MSRVSIPCTAHLNCISCNPWSAIHRASSHRPPCIERAASLLHALRCLGHTLVGPDPNQGPTPSAHLHTVHERLPLSAPLRKTDTSHVAGVGWLTTSTQKTVEHVASHDPTDFNFHHSLVKTITSQGLRSGESLAMPGRL